MVLPMVGEVNSSDRLAVPPTRFAQARGARIAYQDFGRGPTVVAVPPMAQNIEMAWEWPAVRSMFERFGSFARWIQFDKRGTGASDRRSRIPGLDERVDDLRAVMDDAGVHRAFLYGASEGGPMCLLFAATYPDRVDGLILHGSTACFDDPNLTVEGRALRQQRSDFMAEKWGTPESIVAGLFSPTLADDPDYRHWLQRYERLSSDRESLRELLEILYGFDVREVLPELQVPTLVMHRSGDQVIPIHHARTTAQAIPGATLIEHEGIDHFAFAGDRGWLDDLERFVTGTVQHHSEREPLTGTGSEEAPAPTAPAQPSVSTTPAMPATPTVRIRTLGRFAVEVDGEEVPIAVWGGRLPRQLCKRLVVARGWPVTREELFELFWPDESDPARLGARLSVQLSTVRRVLNGAVIADRQTVALNLDEVSTDLEVFHGAATDRETVTRYTGDLLVEDVAEDWAAAAREEARSRFARAARTLAVAATDRGDHDEAVDLARRLLTADRYDEDAHRMVVESLLASNRTAEARRAHDRWSRSLAELGVGVPPFEER